MIAPQREKHASRHQKNTRVKNQNNTLVAVARLAVLRPSFCRPLQAGYS